MGDWIRRNVEFKAQPGKRDIDKHYYNNIALSIMDEVVAKGSTIQAHPAFDPNSSHYVQKLFELVGKCFLMEDQQLKNIA